ncbi:MAG: hypothetical protein ACMXX8_03875, partial [Candidatus Woesearchaeota archaeon]
KGYTKHELRANEQVSANGRSVYLNKEPYKKISDYLKFTIRCEIECNDVKDVEVERDGKKIKLNQGECNVIITGFLVSDYEKKWEKNPVFYFIRGIFDKYVWRDHMYKGESGLVDECVHLHSQVKAFLNLYRYSDG